MDSSNWAMKMQLLFSFFLSEQHKINIYYKFWNGTKYLMAILTYSE